MQPLGRGIGNSTKLYSLRADDLGAACGYRSEIDLVQTLGSPSRLPALLDRRVVVRQRHRVVPHISWSPDRTDHPAGDQPS